MLMLSIKNTMSIAATVFATDCVARLVMDVVQSEVKKAYIEPIFGYIYETTSGYFEQMNEII